MTYLETYLAKNPAANRRDVVENKCPEHFFKDAPSKDEKNDNCFMNSEDPGSSRDNPYDICLTCWSMELKGKK